MPKELLSSSTSLTLLTITLTTWTHVNPQTPHPRPTTGMWQWGRISTNRSTQHPAPTPPSPRLLLEDLGPTRSALLLVASQRLGTSHGFSPLLTLEPTDLLRLRLLPLLLFLLPSQNRAARNLSPAQQTLTLAVAGATWSARGASARSFLELLDVSAAPMAAPPPPAAEVHYGVEIRNVWAANLEQEIAVIREIIDDYPYVAMDTEFPGNVVKVQDRFRCPSRNNYASLAVNVNMLKLIQLGLALSDETGALPPCGTSGRPCIWQFNFRGFDQATDPCNTDSIDLLRRSGIEFDRLPAEGVDTFVFGELLMSSGVVLNADVQWIAFHSGPDFGYLLKLLTGRNIPDTLEEFLNLAKVFFPVLYDVKHLMKYCGKGGGLYGGLNHLAIQLDVERVGNSHQAGSDSLLTLGCFIRLKEMYLRESVKKYAGCLSGLVPGDG